MRQLSAIVLMLFSLSFISYLQPILYKKDIQKPNVFMYTHSITQKQDSRLEPKIYVKQKEKDILDTYSRSGKDFVPRYGFTKEDIYLLAQLICGDESKDGDGEFDFVYQVEHNLPFEEEMGKVLSVVMNRQRSDEFPNTVEKVLLQKGQFSPMYKNLKSKPSDIAIREIEKWCNLYDQYDKTIQVVPENHLYFTAGKNNTNQTREKY